MLRIRRRGRSVVGEVAVPRGAVVDAATGTSPGRHRRHGHRLLRVQPLLLGQLLAHAGHVVGAAAAAAAAGAAVFGRRRRGRSVAGEVVVPLGALGLATAAGAAVASWGGLVAAERAEEHFVGVVLLLRGRGGVVVMASAVVIAPVPHTHTHTHTHTQAKLDEQADREQNEGHSAVPWSSMAV